MHVDLQRHQYCLASVQDNDRLLAMMGAILADTPHKELFDAALVVLGHHYSRSLQIMSSDAYDLTNGIFSCVKVGDLNLMWDFLQLSLGNKSLLYKILGFTDLQDIHDSASVAVNAELISIVLTRV